MKYEFQECIGSRMRGLSRMIDNIYRKHLEGTGLTEHQLSILLAIYEMGPVEQIEIGRLLHLERSSLSRNLVRLTQQGWVTKEGAVNRPVISLSEQGRQKVDEVTPAREQAMDEVADLLGNEALGGFAAFEGGLNRG